MGLFWKIFVSLTIAILASLVGTIYVSVRLTDFAFEQVEFEGRDQIVAQMQAALSAGGRPGLMAWLEHNPRPAPNTIVLVWEHEWWRRPGGRQRGPQDLLNRAMPSQLRLYLDASATPNRQSNRSVSGGNRAVAWPLMTPLTGPAGDQYSYLFTKTPVTILGVWTAPGTQVASVGIALLVGTVTAIGLALYLSSPIVRLQRASRALAGGALDTRVGAPVDRRKDELGTLARDFDRMAERIQALITDKETLLRDVSHELRSPLARMRVALALAQRKVSDAAQPNLARIELEAERLDALVGQVMTLSRLRTATEPTRKPMQIEEIVASVVDDARFEHPNRTVNFVAPPPIHYVGDPDGLKSAVENVLRNALAYSPPDKPIDVAVERKPSTIEVRVRDRGPGVEPRHLQRIFEPFYRTDESRDHRQDGQGIGLAITARVMELHGGSVEAANCSDGGLQITFKLPVEGTQAEGERGRKRRAD